MALRLLLYRLLLAQQQATSTAAAQHAQQPPATAAATTTTTTTTTTTRFTSGAAVSIRLPHLTITVSGSGNVTSVLGSSGSSTRPRELALAGTKLLVARFANAASYPPYGEVVGASAITLANDSTIFAQFQGTSGATASVRLRLRLSGEFAVVSIASATSSIPIEQLDFLNIGVAGLGRCAFHLAGAYDDDFGLFVTIGGMQTAVLAQGTTTAAGVRRLCGANGTVLTARSLENNAGGQGTNRSAVLWGGPASRLAVAVQQAEVMMGLPSPMLDGVWAKQAPEAKKGYWLINANVLVDQTNRTKLFALAAAAGVPYIALVGWATTSGHYNVSAELGGLGGLISILSQLRAHGLRAGLHTMSGNIAFTDRYVTPIPDPRLAKSSTRHFLALALSASASSITVNTSTASMPPTGALQIGNEIVTYSGIKSAAPFGLTGLVRGAYNTTVSSYPVGTLVARLLETGLGFLPDPHSDLLDEIAANIACVFDAAWQPDDVRLLYFDGAELMPPGSDGAGEGMMCRAFAKHLGSSTIIESSTLDPYCYHLVTRRGQLDWGATAVRAYFDSELKTQQITQAKDNLFTPDLGWAGIFDYSPGGEVTPSGCCGGGWYATTPQQLEYLASKAIAYGGAPSLEMAGGPDGLDGGLTTNGRAMEGMHLMGAWLKLNLSIPESVKALLRQPGLDHELRNTSSGGKSRWWITPVKVHTPFVVNPRIPASLNVSLPATFPDGATYMVRVRAHTAIAMLGHPKNVQLLGENTTDHMTVGCPVDFAFKAGSIPTPVPNASLTVSLVPSPLARDQAATDTPAKSLRLGLTAPTLSGIGCAQFNFHSAANLTTHRPLALLIYGDSSGALLNVQLQDNHGLIHSHFVRIDFSGWKSVALDRFETGAALFVQQFPRTLFPDDVRGFNTAAIMAVNLYLTGVRQATIFVGAIEALSEDLRPRVASSAGAQISIGGVVNVPDGLNAAVCRPGENYSHYRAAGGCADYAECDMGTGRCRSFGADNVELFLPAMQQAELGGAATEGPTIDFRFSSTSAGRVEVTIFEKGSSAKLGPFVEQLPHSAVTPLKADDTLAFDNAAKLVHRTTVTAPSPIAKRIRWFIDDSAGTTAESNLRFVFKTHADIVDGVYPCCGFGSVIATANHTAALLHIRDEVASTPTSARNATDAFYRRLLRAHKAVIPTLSGGAFPVEAFHRRDELATEVAALVQRRNLSGITLDYEGRHENLSSVATVAQFAATWGGVAAHLHAQKRGAEFGICMNENQDGHPPSMEGNGTEGWIDYTVGGAYTKYIPFADVMTDMTTYPYSTRYQAPSQQTLTYLETMIIQLEKQKVDAASGQLSPGIWLGTCFPNSTMRPHPQLHNVSTSTWTQKFLRTFLTFLHTRGVRSIDIWADAGDKACPMPCPSTPTCSWVYDELRAWKAMKTDNVGACAVVDISTGTETLHEAQQQARKAAAACVVVKLGHRSYQLFEPLVLTSADANTHWNGDGAEITTGYDVPFDAWVQTTENGVDAVQLNVSLLVNRSQWGRFTLSNGLEDAHLSLLVQIDDVWRPMSVARWPNIPFQYKDSPPVNWTGVASTECAPSNTSCLQFTWAADTDRPARWVNAAREGRLFLHGFFASLWSDSRGMITDVDVATRQLRSNTSYETFPFVEWSQQNGGVNNQSKYYAYGMHEELDAEGEYILRNDTGMLSAVMPAGCMKDGKILCATRLIPDIKKLHFQDCLIVGHAYLTSLNCTTVGVIQVISTANITLRGLNITGSFGTGVTIFGGTGITIDSCAINNVNDGLVVGTLANKNQTSKDVSLLRSEIGYTRCSSSRWIGGVRDTLTPSGFLIESNRFHDFGLYKYVISPGVVAGGVGTMIRKNEFKSALHMAILFGGNDHLIEKNDIHHVTTITFDSGAIYAGRDLSSRGTMIRWNRLHHLDAEAPCDSHTSCIRMGIYMDDFLGGTTVYGNIFYKVQTGFFSNCGGDMNFTNNLFVEAEVAIRQVGLDLAQNLYQPFLGTDQFLYMLLHLVPFEGALWKSRYPELATRFSTWTNSTDPPPLGTTVPLGNSFETNVVVNFSTPRAWACKTCPQKANTTAPGWVPKIYPNNFIPNASDGMFSLAYPWTHNARFFDVKSGNVKLTNPGFFSGDPGGELDFSLRSDSPLFKLGWLAIPERDIGPTDNVVPASLLVQADSTRVGTGVNGDGV